MSHPPGPAWSSSYFSWPTGDGIGFLLHRFLWPWLVIWPNGWTVTAHKLWAQELIEISSQHTPILPPSTTDTLDTGLTSPLFTQEKVNPFSASVNQHATASGSSNPQQPASPNVINVKMLGVAGNCNGAVAAMLKGKRDREFGCVSSREQEKSSLSDNISKITLKEKPRELKWRGIGWFRTKDILIGRQCMKPTVNLNHWRQSYIMQTVGLVKLKWKAEECLKNWRCKVDCATRFMH